MYNLLAKRVGHHSWFMASCSIMLGKPLFIPKLFLSGWEMLLLEDVLVLAVILWGRTSSLAEKQPHTRMASGCFTVGIQQPQIIRENHFTPVFSSPFSSIVDYQSIPDVLPGEMWLLCCPSWHQAILRKSSAPCVCRCTHTCLLRGGTPVKPFWCKAMMTAHVSLQTSMMNRGRTMISSTTLLLSLLF